MLRRILVLCVVPSAGGCFPDTDLLGERAHPPLAPAAGELVEPPPGASDVPRNLAALLVRFAEMPPHAPAFHLHDDGGRAAATAEAAQDPECDGAACYRVPIVAPLDALAGYSVEAADGARSAVIGRFTTADGVDDTAPRVAGFTVEPAGPCLRARWTTDEPAEARIVLRAGGRESEQAAGTGLLAFDVSVRIDVLPPASDGEALVRVRDTAGNQADSDALPLRTPEPLAPLVMTEVLANPAGSETTQEFVEIRNLGAAPLSLGGLRIEDATGADTLWDAEIPGGGFALIVPGGFEESTDKDVPPRPGTVVVRVDGRLGGDGLGNSGEAVRLRAPGGAEITSYGGWVDVSSPAWNGMSVQRLQADACDQPSSWSSKPRPPTPGW